MSLAISKHAALSRDLTLCLVGSAAFGAAAGAGYGAQAMLHGALAAPALFVGGAALAVPPLYLFTALSGGEASTSDVVRSSARSLLAVSVALLGLAAPVAFFSVSMRSDSAFALLLCTVVAVGGAGVFAVAGDALSRERRGGARFASVAWCVFALALGARLIQALGHTVGLIGGR